MVLPTWTMEWHARQPSPACASGSWTSSVTGRSNFPSSSSATSWHPAHHFEAGTPAMPCMYSIDLRYHWLLNDEKWCIDERHCFTMSGWQPAWPQLSEVRKKFEGMRPL